MHCIVFFHLLVLAAAVVPRNPIRSEGTYEWCDCSTGNSFVDIWPTGRSDLKITVGNTQGKLHWFQFGDRVPVKSIEWKCDMQGTIRKTSFEYPKQWWSVQHFSEVKSSWGFCNQNSGRLKFASWDEASDNHPSGFSVVTNVLSIPFASGEEDYYCIKIPVLLKLRNGDIVAFAEARRLTCSDFASTDLVQKRSIDDGMSWGPLIVVRSLYNASDPKSFHTVVGNAAPIQLSPSNPFFANRILLPHNVNNSQQWVQHSDDNANTWSQPHLISEATLPEWRWVASGPPGSIELSARHPVKPYRILFGGYHSAERGNLANNNAHGHSVYSDDGGTTWAIGAIGYGSSHNGTVHGDDKERPFHFNEHQYVELKDGRILANSRSMAVPLVSTMDRLRAVSYDGGLTFPDTRKMPELRSSLTGNEGSMVRDIKRDLLYYSGTHDYIYRTGLSLYRSSDSGETWERILEVDSFMSGYSSLQIDSKTDQLQLLYEQTDQRQLVMDPDRFIYRSFGLHDLSQRAAIGNFYMQSLPEQEITI